MAWPMMGLLLLLLLLELADPEFHFGKEGCAGPPRVRPDMRPRHLVLYKRDKQKKVEREKTRKKRELANREFHFGNEGCYQLI